MTAFLSFISATSIAYGVYADASKLTKGAVFGFGILCAFCFFNIMIEDATLMIKKAIENK